MALPHDIKFIDNAGLNGSRDRYVTVTLDAKRALKSWQLSLFSFEWLNKDGSIKTLEQLPEQEQVKRRASEDKIKTGQPIERPVLGIGISDNIEIGMGRADFLTLAALGATSIQVHVPRTCESDFKAFRADIK